MLRIALRVRLRFRSAQDDTETEESEKMKVKNNPSVTLPRATSLCTKEAEVTFVSNEVQCKIYKKPSPVGEGVERSETDEVF